MLHGVSVVVLVVLALGFAAGRSSRRTLPTRPHRPSWTASPEQRELATRLERAADHYRNGRRGRAEGLLANPLVNWDVVADAAEQSTDALARRIGAILRAPRGQRQFIAELGRCDATDCQTALTALIAALRGAGSTPAVSDRVS